jgi:hypothetical protein
MATLIARNDTQIVQQISTATPAAVTNASTYGLKLNGKLTSLYTSDAGTSAQEIVEGMQAILAAYTAAQFPEAKEVTWTENDILVTGTGPTNGKPFTLVNNTASDVDFTVATPTVAKSPNHWIAENFDTLTLPANGDTVHITQLGEAQSFYWGLDQNTVTLAALHIKADSEARIGLPEYNTDSTQYYQASYRDTFLKIGASILTIGDGAGQGARSIKINLGAVDCAATIYKTSSNPLDQDEAPVQLSGGTASSTLQVMSGKVDLAMLPGHTGSWTQIDINSGTVRCGTGVTLATVNVQGTIETRSAVTTYSIRPGSSAIHIGAVNITTANVQSKLEIRATGALTVGTTNAYSGGSIDLSKCDSLVTFTNITVHATTNAPFIIEDPNNKSVFTNAVSCPNGAQSFIVRSGASRTVRIV